MRPPNSSSAPNILTRVRLWYGALLIISAVFVVRLFYLQVIRYDFYKKAALSSQLKQYEIPAERGIIEAHDGTTILPIVLNEKKYTLFADPKYITDPGKVADSVARVIGGNAKDYEALMRQDTRYSVLAKKLSPQQKQQLDDLDFKGLGTREEEYRTYPQGGLAAQLLGFVNDNGEGKYGIEQFLDSTLKGTPGELKAITDASGVPLVTNKDNIVTAPKPGKRVVLTIDVSIQQQLQEALKLGLRADHANSGSVVVMDVHSGAIKAMANYPSYNPAEFYKVSDAGVFNDAAVSAPLEVGSIMKTLTTTAALDQGVVHKNTTYYDPSHFTIDGATVRNVEEDGGAGTKSISDILRLSLNTGATWLLMQMGGGSINEKARVAWHNYLVDHYHFGKATGIEQGYEAPGSIPDPIQGYGLNIQYANTAFGQGMTVTPLQMAAAISAVLNGGTYYRPRLVDQIIDERGKVEQQTPDILSRNIVKPETARTLQSLMQFVAKRNNYTNQRPGFIVGGKTGTAQVPKPGGGYYDGKYNGTFVGFVGGDRPQYVIMVRVNEPHVLGYAGIKAAAPIFSRVVNMLIDNFAVTPQTK